MSVLGFRLSGVARGALPTRTRRGWGRGGCGEASSTGRELEQLERQKREGARAGRARGIDTTHNSDTLGRRGREVSKAGRMPRPSVIPHPHAVFDSFGVGDTVAVAARGVACGGLAEVEEMAEGEALGAVLDEREDEWDLRE
eukprot:scaffold21893_cov37-Phaeocystis_antarctica.AAC.1